MPSDGGVGTSANGPESPVGAGAVEWQDVVGVLQHVSQHPQFQALDVALMSQCMGDVYTTNTETGINDVEVSFDRCPTSKHLVWIGPDQPRAFGTGRRVDGYNSFNDHPQELLDFLAAHIGRVGPTPAPRR